jgi:hypothetical protein
MNQLLGIFCYKLSLIISVFIGCISFHVGYGQTPEKTKPVKLPHLKTTGGITRLIVHNKPFIMLAGEVNNSACSSLKYMEPIWSRLKALNLNTVIGTVPWELVEPEENKFDFTLVDGLIRDARKHDLKLVLIWFGTWKNTWSTYVPAWVKKDTIRFPRLHTKPDIYSGALSAFGKESFRADAKAFAALMRHIKEIDSRDNTVIMMQVENETGVHTSRDRSPLAEHEFQKKVPDALMDYLKKRGDACIPELKNMMASTGNIKQGTWQEVFGYGADEVFMGWHIASYVEEVAKAGKQEYDLPMYVNAWLDPDFSTSLKPDYPSGGPVSKIFDVWRAAAPSIDFFAPDIYLDDFKKVCEQYTQADNPLFIPEAKRDVRAAANVFYALGQHQALGFSPFKIDVNQPDDPLGKSYGTLLGFLPFLSEHQNSNNSIGLLCSNTEKETVELGGYRIEIEYTQKREIEKKQPEAAGLILHTHAGEFYVVGFGIKVNFLPLPNDSAIQVEYLINEEGIFKDGQWIPGRKMNGDEYKIELRKSPEFRRVTLHKF